eukprot:CAMPEP_0195280982 /NCGR_PEP_ID=MMETSP0707-20130614/471_1 /TAXON_ID=33640 /ORGANISM="Asterionellopsis glacialis, Strain CCMP134" /LENGTH=502 /DNA_ID=CAMNT_0040339817 /DNA_START=49 /DNA_END=1557 /DNA_ORIENTATION=+
MTFSDSDTHDDDSFVEVMDMETTSPGATAAEKAALTLSVTPKHDIIGIDAPTGTIQICASTQAADLNQDDVSKRAPVDIIVALDVSGSMTGEKLRLCKKTLELLLRFLLPGDRFGLVSFADDAILEFSPTTMTPDRKQVALKKIKSLHTRGCTNISGAIGLAAQEMFNIDEPNKVRSIFLLTDGHANRGVSSSKGICDIAKGCLVESGKDNGTPPVTMHCFGYGEDHDDSMLQSLSEATQGGTYYFLDDDSNVASAFGDALGGILSVVAQNATLHIKPAPGCTIVDVHHEHKLEQKNGTYTVTLGDFYAEEKRDVLFEVTLSPPNQDHGVGEINSPIPQVSVHLSFMDTIHKSLVDGDSVTCSIGRPSGEEVSVPNHYVTVQWIRIKTSEDIQKADALSAQDNLEAARVLIQGSKDYIQAQPSDVQSDPLVRQILFDLEEVRSGMSSTLVYRTRGKKQMKMKYQTHAMQRSNEADLDIDNCYRSSTKMRFATFMKRSLNEEE